MKKFWLTRFIVIIYCASIVIGCRPTKQRPCVDKNDNTNDRQKRGMIVNVSTTTDTPTPGNIEAEQVSTTVINETIDNMSITDATSNRNTSNIQETEFSKDKGSEGTDNPLPSSDEEQDEVKSRKTRQKTYKCYCEEASYQSDCLKKCQSAKQFVEDDYTQDISIEMTEDPLEAYTNKVPRTTTESAKFSIPYAKNVNFDQRVILGNNLPQSYSFYSNPQIKIPKNHLFPIYPQTPQLQYAIAYPGIVRNGISPIKQSYLRNGLRKPVLKETFMPSIVGRKFANIQECIKLYGKTVCVIAPTTKSPVPSSEITTIVDFMTGNSAEKNINEIHESYADNNQNQNMKTTGYPNHLIHQSNTISPLYEIKYSSMRDPKLKSSVRIDKLYSIDPNPAASPNYYVVNKQQPYSDDFSFGKKILSNNNQNQNLKKSFNGKYYLNKNDMNIAQASSPIKNGKEQQLNYIQTLGITTPRPITQKPVYATKYPFPTTPSYSYLDEPLNDYSTNYKNPMHDDAGGNYLQDTSYAQQNNYDASGHFTGQATRYPAIQFQNPTTVSNIRHNYDKESKFVNNQPMYLHNEYQSDQAHSSLNGIQSVVGDRLVGSQGAGIPYYSNLLEQTTISPLLQMQPTSIYVKDEQKSDYQSRPKENVASSKVQMNYEKMNENNYHLAKANNNFAQGLSPTNTEKDRKLIISKEYSKYNSNVKVASSEMNSYTSNYVLNSNPEIEHTTESIMNIENTLQPKSEDRDSSRILTSIRKEYDTDNSEPMRFSHDPQYNHQGTYKNVNYYKSDSVQSNDNELYYSSNEALNHEKYKNNERPQPQFDYSNFPQSMTRIINEANGQYINSQYPQYRQENIFKKYPKNRIYDNKNNLHDDPYNIQYVHPTANTPIIQNYEINSGFSTDLPNTNTYSFNDYIAQTVIPKTDSRDPTSYVNRNIPVRTTISMSHTTPPSWPHNQQAETENQGNNYLTTYPYLNQNEKPLNNYEYQDRYNTRLPLQSSNLKKQDEFRHPDLFDNTQVPNLNLNPKFESNTFTSETNSELLRDTAQSITTLENLESNEYKKNYNPTRTSTERYVNDPNINEPNVQSRKKYPSKLSKQKIRNKMFNDTENLFRGLEQIILNNYDPILSEENIDESVENSVSKNSTQKGGTNKDAEKILFGNLNGQIKENIEDYGQVAVSETDFKKPYIKGLTGTENPIQSVDDIPVTVRENYSDLATPATIVNNDTKQQAVNEILVQNAIRKVINNFVPGKAEDLMANYENKNAKEIVGAKASSLLPEIVGAPILRNLLGIPEIENMIVDVVAGLMGRMTNVVLGDLFSFIKSSFRRVVNKDIPSPKPTSAPFTVEEHRFQDGEWVTEQVSLLGSSKDELKSLPREVFDKIKNILYRSKISEKEAEQPLVQNLIVKAVKHSLDKERGIVQESAIRKAFKIIVKPTKGKILPPYKSTSAAVKKATTPKPKATTELNESYKLAPVVPITENNFRDGYWKESRKLLVDSSGKKASTDFDESAKKALQKQLDKVKKIKVTSEETEDRYTDTSNINVAASSEYEYEDENEYSYIEGNAKAKDSLKNTYDENLDRQPIKYYSPTDRVLEYIKTHQIALQPSLTTTAEIIGRTNEYDTTTPNSLKSKSQTVTNDERNLGKNNQYFGDLLSEDLPKSTSDSETYMGRLVPVDEKASQAKNLNDLENSHLVYLGDGVRLPLTIRKLPDGTFALTFSDEICKQFLHKQCPCCLSDSRNGFIVRQQKSIKDGPEWTILNNESETTTENIISKAESQPTLQRQFKDEEPSKVTIPTEYLGAHISSHLENQKESEEQNTTPSKVEQNSNANIYSRIRRESEEQKHAVQKERFADRESFMENDVEPPMQNENKVLLVTSQMGNDNNGLQQLDNSYSESFENQFDYQQEEPFDLGLPVIPRMIGPYRYQQLYAKENADALRNMFHMIQRIDSGEE